MTDDKLQTQWTNHTDFDCDWYYLGAKKNEAGYCINCNGAVIEADDGVVGIATFDEDGFKDIPYIYIDEDNFIICDE